MSQLDSAIGLSSIGTTSPTTPQLRERWVPPTGPLSEPARRALVASLSVKSPTRDDAALAELVDACDRDELVAWAVSEGVAASASPSLAPFLSPAQRDKLDKAARQNAVRHFSRLAWLQKFGAALDALGVQWVVLKGPVLAELSYKGVIRSYSDLDLLVPARQLRLAVQALELVGAAIPDQDWPQLVKQAKGELSMAVHGSPLVDLHWHLVYHRSARDRFMIPTDELLERRRHAQLRTVEAWVLDPADFAAHIALHASFAGGHRLRRLLDIERTLANQPVDWDVFVNRCQSWRVGLPVAALLHCARETLGAAVPNEVVRELAGGQLEYLFVRRLGNWAPTGRWPGGRSFRTGLSRSLRDGLLATAAQFASETGQALHDLVRHEPPAETTTGPGFSNIDGLAGLERFIEMANSADNYGHLSKRQLSQPALP
jgi:hypothetical protein